MEDVKLSLYNSTTRRTCTVWWISERLFRIYELNLWFSMIFDSVPITKNTVLVRRIDCGRPSDLSLSWSAASDLISRFDPTMKIRFVEDQNDTLSESVTRRICTVRWNLMLIIQIYERNLWFSKFFKFVSSPKDGFCQDCKLMWCKSLVKSTEDGRVRFYEGLLPSQHQILENKMLIWCD